MDLGDGDPPLARQLFETRGRRNRRPRVFGLHFDLGGLLNFENSGVDAFAPCLRDRLESRLRGQVRVDRVDGVHGSSLGTVPEFGSPTDGPHPGAMIPTSADHFQVDRAAGNFGANLNF